MHGATMKNAHYFEQRFSLTYGSLGQIIAKIGTTAFLSIKLLLTRLTLRVDMLLRNVFYSISFYLWKQKA